MEFPLESIIEDRRGERRWRIKSSIKYPQYTLWSVEDCAPTMGKRLLWLLTLNYQTLPDRDRALAIGTLRESLIKVTELLCVNHTFLPEPVDIIQFFNNQDAMEPLQREHEVALIFGQSSGRSPVLRSSELNELMAMKGKLLIPIIKTLHQLHRQKTIIQSIPLSSVNINQITQSPYLTGFTSLINLDSFIGYNGNKSVLRPDPLYAAPECFDPDGRLSPATDVYALGKLILQIILKDKYKHYITRNHPFPKDLQNLVNSLNLPDPWPRFLALCLQHDPKQRFQNVNELEIFWKPRQEQLKIELAQQTRTQQSSSNSKPKPKPTNPSGHYRENTQLPNAALIIWDENLTDKGESLQYRDIYKEFQYQYNFKPRLFFQKNYKNINTDNPFYKMLQENFGLQLMGFEKSQAVATLNAQLAPYLGQFNHLILVGNSDEYVVQCLLMDQNYKNLNIHWVRKGKWNPADLCPSGKYAHKM